MVEEKAGTPKRPAPRMLGGRKGVTKNVTLVSRTSGGVTRTPTASNPRALPTKSTSKPIEVSEVSEVPTETEEIKSSTTGGKIFTPPNRLDYIQDFIGGSPTTSTQSQIAEQQIKTTTEQKTLNKAGFVTGIPKAKSKYVTFTGAVSVEAGTVLTTTTKENLYKSPSQTYKPKEKIEEEPKLEPLSKARRTRLRQEYFKSEYDKLEKGVGKVYQKYVFPDLDIEKEKTILDEGKFNIRTGLAGVRVAVGQTFIEKPVSTTTTIGVGYTFGGIIGYSSSYLASLSTKTSTLVELGGYTLGGLYAGKVGTEFISAETNTEKLGVIRETAFELQGFSIGAKSGATAGAYSGFIPLPSSNYRIGYDPIKIKNTKTGVEETVYSSISYRQESTGKGGQIIGFKPKTKPKENILYHGTTKESAKLIIKEGLKPHSETGIKKGDVGGESKDSVFLTNDPR